VDEHTIYHNLLEAMGQSGCPICRLSDRAVDGYLDHLLYADVNSIERRAEIRAARGFCADHGAALMSIGRALGIAIIYKDVLDNILRALPAGPTASAASALSPDTACPACRYYATMQDIYIGGFIQHLETAAFRERVLASEGLCLTHFGHALACAMDASRRQFLYDQQIERWQTLSGELGEYIRKNDYRFRSEGFGGESNSWERALLSISGGRDIKESDERQASRIRFLRGRKKKS
jgi:hypothetical protein